MVPFRRVWCGGWRGRCWPYGRWIEVVQGAGIRSFEGLIPSPQEARLSSPDEPPWELQLVGAAGHLEGEWPDDATTDGQDEHAEDLFAWDKPAHLAAQPFHRWRCGARVVGDQRGPTIE